MAHVSEKLKAQWDWPNAVETVLWACVAAVAAGLLSGCATIVHGSKEQVEVQSEPSGARVEINGRPAGTTPTTVRLRRDTEHTIRLYKNRYEPREIAIRRKVSWWSYLNVLNLYVPGALIDVSTGAFYGLAPDQISATLEMPGAQDATGAEGNAGGEDDTGGEENPEVGGGP